MRIAPVRRSAQSLVALSASTLLIMTLAGPISATGSGSPPDTADPPATGPALEGPSTVTLLTGDRVTLSPADDEPEVTFDPAPGSEPTGFTVHRDGADVHVVPNDVASLVPDVLDPALFNVTALVEMGYDDQHADDLPLIVRSDGGAGTFSDDAGPLRTVEQLESIGGAAVELDKEDAADLGAALAGIGEPRPMAAADALGGVEKIWLDSKVEAAALDGYLDQIEAPAAWESGLDGSGVRVAVLDTGVDDEHPALAGQVSAHANFTDTESAADVHGHGTHVASLVAGTGAGADGARQGVAPGSTVLSGKVLDDEGTGQASWVIAGMEWAVGQGADIVNLSLGGAPSETDDPVVESLEELTEQAGALFVVAAGNNGGLGFTLFTIDSPGTAASALTVGAVTETDHTAMFSSNGPTLGDYRIKPDVTAPGVDIPGAQAGAHDGELYVPMSGTSMATPIVAGAAALLIQQRPDWSWEEIKAHIVTTAEPHEAQVSWSHGGGRLDLDRVVHQELSATPAALDFGYLRYPDDKEPQSRTVTLTNDGTEPVSVDVVTDISDLNGVPDDTSLVADPASLTVPAGGTATTTLTLDPVAMADGLWDGGVSFVSGDTALLRLPFGAYNEAEMYELEVQVLDREGDPYDPATGADHPFGDTTIPVFDGENGMFYRLHPDESGYASTRVEPGNYSLFARVVTPAGDDEPETMTIAGEPGLEVRSDTSYVIDAREARRLDAPTIPGQPVEVEDAAGIAYSRRSENNGRSYTEYGFFDPEEVAGGQLYVTPTEPVDIGQFETSFRWRLAPTGKVKPNSPDAYELLLTDPEFPDPLSPDLTRRDVAELAQVETVYHPIGEPGEYLYGTSYLSTGTGITFIHRNSIDVPATRNVLMTAEPDVLWGHELIVPMNEYRAFRDDLRAYESRERVENRIGGTLRPEPYVAGHSANSMHAEIGLGDGTHASQVPVTTPESSELALYKDGVLVERVDGVANHFRVPEEPGRFRLEQRWLLGTEFTSSREARTVWTFDSAPPDDDHEFFSTTPPLLMIDVDADLDGLGGTKARRPLHLDVRARHVSGADAPERIESMELWWSVDDGETWREAPARRSDADTFRATLLPVGALQAGTSVSLRAVATDAAGNEVDQTVLGMIPVR